MSQNIIESSQAKNSTLSQNLSTDFENQIDFSLIELLPSGRVEARNLHKFLGVGDHFPTWICRLIQARNFEMNKQIFHKTTQSKTKPRIDYELSVDCAIEICILLSLSKKRILARKYLSNIQQATKNNISIKESLLLKLYSNNPLEVATAYKALLELEINLDRLNQLKNRKLNNSIYDR